MSPPFNITPKILQEISIIERHLGRIESLDHPKPKPHLRKTNRVRTIQGTLAIEGNTLLIDQITAILEGKPVIGNKDEIQEVKNAIQLYQKLEILNPLSSKDLLTAHKITMSDLIPNAGKWRTKNVGILKGSSVSHIAPQSDRVPYLIADLFKFLKDEQTHPLIRSCVLHYELEFIHPFQDGNGRIGRFWHSLLLFHYHPAFEFIPVESIIKENQTEYYHSLETSDRAGDSTTFIEFSLSTIRQALENFLQVFKPSPLTPTERLHQANAHFKNSTFSRKKYMDLHKTISTATASRDLQLGVDQNALTKSGEKSLTTYSFIE